MPKLKKPQLLEELAIKALVNYLRILGEHLMPIIIEISKHDSKKSSNMLKNNIKVIKEIFLYNIPCFLYDRLRYEIFKEIPILIDQLKKRMDLRPAMGEFFSRCNIIISLSEIIMTSNLTHLNFEEMPKVIRHLYYNKLHLMTGLRALNLGSLSGGWKSTDMEPIILNGILKMKYLQHLCLNYDCTDNILLGLIESCPKIVTLDLSSSKSITNDSCNILVHLKSLKNLQLYRTAVSMDGFIKLLLNLPNLEDIGRYDEIGRCLEYIVDNYPDNQIFKLKKFTSRFVTTKFLQILCVNCPQIYYVSIFHNVLLCDLMALVGINKLCELRLLSCDFFADQIRNLLSVKGCNLTHLHLEHVDEIDMNALMYISQFCPDLKILAIYNCDLIESTSLSIRKLNIPPFMNLERLTLIAQCTLKHLAFLLSTCYKIQYIHLGTAVPTNDNLFNNILSSNSMLHLKELSILCSDGLTIATAYKLAEICDNLTELNELEGWTQIRDYELDLFKIFIKTNNIDLNIKSKRFISS